MIFVLKYARNIKCKKELYFISVEEKKRQDYSVEATENWSEFKYLYKYKRWKKERGRKGGREIVGCVQEVYS